jgi:hypothetical protein
MGKRGRAQVTEIDLTRASIAQKALFRAMLLYVNNPGLSLRHIWGKLPVSDEENAAPIRECVSWSLLEKTAAEDQWREKRAEHWATIEQRVLRELQSDRIKQELEEVHGLEQIRIALMQRITGVVDPAHPGSMLVMPAEPKSLEGVVTAYIKLDKHALDRRRAIDEAVAARKTPGNEIEGDSIDVETVPVEDNMTDAEIRALADTLARQRAGLISKDEDDAAPDDDSEHDEE